MTCHILSLQDLCIIMIQVHVQCACLKNPVIITNYTPTQKSTVLSAGTVKGVGPGMTLAWAGWKQPDIAVEVDTGQLETSRFKKCCANCVILYFPSTEFKSAFNVYWHGGGAAGLSCTELSIWEFPFLRGFCWQGWTSIWYCEKGMPQKDTLDNLRTPVCFRILSSSFTSVSIFSVSCYSIVSISVIQTVTRSKSYWSMLDKSHLPHLTQILHCARGVAIV